VAAVVVVVVVVVAAVASGWSAFTSAIGTILIHARLLPDISLPGPPTIPAWSVEPTNNDEDAAKDEEEEEEEDMKDILASAANFLMCKISVSGRVRKWSKP